jgi:hypothetical protein
LTGAVIALLPVFLVIAGGYALRRTELIAASHWAGIDRLCYFVLFPAFFFKEIGTADFSALPVFRIGLGMALAIIVMSAALVAMSGPLRAALRMNGPQFSSLFQGITRWHTFIAFALVPLYFDRGMLALAALAAAVMTPILNIICVAVIARYASTTPPSLTMTAKMILQNPFLLSSLAGLMWNAGGFPMPPAMFQGLDIVARGALGLALLSVGAGLRLETFSLHRRSIAAATMLKLLVMPALVFLIMRALGVSGEAAAVAVLCNAVPTGSGAYVLARQLGGDAPLIANILTIQVIAAAVTIPAVVTVMGY